MKGVITDLYTYYGNRTNAFKLAGEMDSKENAEPKRKLSAGFSTGVVMRKVGFSDSSV